MRRLIINADDFGWTDGHNQAVERAHRQGALSRASLLCNGGAFAEAVELARRLPTLGVGVHLTLSEGRPLLPPGRLGPLVRGDGTFHDRVLPLLLLWQAGRLPVAAVLPEWRAQVERALAAGLTLTHLDSHKHVHLLPPLCDALLLLAQEYRVPYVRLPVEPLSLPAARRGPGWLAMWLLGRRARRRMGAGGLAHADRFVGFGHSGALTAGRLQRLIEETPGQTVEIMVHPATLTPQVEALRRRYGWARRYRFEAELEALCAPAVRLAAERFGA